MGNTWPILQLSRLQGLSIYYGQRHSLISLSRTAGGQLSDPGDLSTLSDFLWRYVNIQNKQQTNSPQIVCLDICIFTAYLTSGTHSLLNGKQYRGHKTDPWRTSLLTDNHRKNSPFITACCFLCKRKDLTQFRRFPEIP